jgi:hypothetical protein
MNTTRVTNTPVAHVSQPTITCTNVTFHQMYCTLSKPTNCLITKTTRTLFAFPANKIEYKNLREITAPASRAVAPAWQTPSIYQNGRKPYNLEITHQTEFGLTVLLVCLFPAATTTQANWTPQFHPNHKTTFTSTARDTSFGFLNPTK